MIMWDLGKCLSFFIFISLAFAAVKGRKSILLGKIISVLYESNVLTEIGKVKHSKLLISSHFLINFRM